MDSRLNELKQKSFVAQLPPSIRHELKVTGYDLYVTYEVGEEPKIKVIFDLAFPSATIELTEDMPPIQEITPEKYGMLLGNVLNNRLASIWKGVQTHMSYTTVLVDGNNLAHRAKHVYKLSHHGLDTSILYGVLRSLTVMYKKFSPYRIVVCFDDGIPAQRKELSFYKSNRHVDETEEYLLTREQIAKLASWLPNFGFITSKVKGYEADDVIAAHTRKLIALISEPKKILVVSGDKDMYQLVGPKVDVSDPMNDLLVTVDNFESITGIPLKSWLLYRALVGDSSDKIPGVVGIGPVMAKKLVGEHPTSLELHQALRKGSVSSRATELIAEAGGMSAIYATLNCINLQRCQPDDKELFTGSIIPAGMVWKEVEVELMQLGFVSLLNDDMFRDMVIKFSNRHGMIG